MILLRNLSSFSTFMPKNRRTDILAKTLLPFMQQQTSGRHIGPPIGLKIVRYKTTNASRSGVPIISALRRLPEAKATKMKVVLVEPVVYEIQWWDQAEKFQYGSLGARPARTTGRTVLLLTQSFVNKNKW